MERRKSENLTDVVVRFLRDSGLQTPLNEYRIVASWREVMGELVAEQTTEIFIRSQVLHVRLSSPALRANLLMNRKRICQMLNEKVGVFVVADLVVM